MSLLHANSLENAVYNEVFYFGGRLKKSISVTYPFITYQLLDSLHDSFTSYRLRSYNEANV